MVGEDRYPLVTTAWTSQLHRHSGRRNIASLSEQNGRYSLSKIRSRIAFFLPGEESLGCALPNHLHSVRSNTIRQISLNLRHQGLREFERRPWHVTPKHQPFLSRELQQRRNLVRYWIASQVVPHLGFERGFNLLFRDITSVSGGTEFLTKPQYQETIEEDAVGDYSMKMDKGGMKRVL